MINFWLKESFRSMKRTKASFTLSVITFTIAVLLVFFSFFLYGFTGLVNRHISNNLVLNVFLSDSLVTNTSESIKNEINAYPFTSEIRYVNKDEAEKIFIQETGEEFKKILEYNPLPASFTVTLKNEYLNRDSIHIIITLLSSIQGVEKVVYQPDIADNIINLLNKIKLYTLVFTLVLVFISLIIIFSTLKLVISSRYDEFETIKLIGAKISSVKMPVLLNGLFIGIIADFIALIGIYIIILNLQEFSSLILTLLQENLFLASIMVLFAPVTGLGVSALTLKKVSLKI